MIHLDPVQRFEELSMIEVRLQPRLCSHIDILKWMKGT